MFKVKAELEELGVHFVKLYDEWHAFFDGEKVAQHKSLGEVVNNAAKWAGV